MAAPSSPATTTGKISPWAAPSKPSEQYSAGRIDRNELLEVERHSCPGVGSCGGMFTANTMSSAIEAMGMSFALLLHHGRRRRRKVAKTPRESARVLADAVASQLLPRQIMTRKAFENAIAVVNGRGRLHQRGAAPLAIAHSANVPLCARRFRSDSSARPGACAI
jgi:dihydroxy-acid dehydratase